MKAAITINSPLKRTYTNLLRQKMRVGLQSLKIRIARPFMRMAHVAWIEGELRLRKYDNERGVWIDYGVVSHLLTTTVGRAFFVDDWDNDATDITTMDFHGYGTGVAAEAVGDTVLGTEVETPRGTTVTRSQPTSTQFRQVQTHTFLAT